MAAADSTRAAGGSSGKTAPMMENGGKGGGGPPPVANLSRADFCLRLLLLASSLTALVVMVTGKQTEEIVPDPTVPSFTITSSAKFKDTPADIFLVVVLGVTVFYGVVTLVTSAFAVKSSSPSTKLVFLLLVLDMIMVGVLASAIGAAFSDGYVALKGNSHVGWEKICNIFDKYCYRGSIAIGIAVVASVVLDSLIVVSSYSLYRRSR